MATPKIFESEYRFCLILWEREPVSSAELAKICKEKLGWSRTTTYTVIHRLSERGVVKNESGLYFDVSATFLPSVFWVSGIFVSAITMNANAKMANAPYISGNTLLICAFLIPSGISRPVKMMTAVPQSELNEPPA